MLYQNKGPHEVEPSMRSILVSPQPRASWSIKFVLEFYFLVFLVIPNGYPTGT